MNTQQIFDKAESGNKLSSKELHALMSHAIVLLKFIEDCTQESISRAHELLEKQYKKAA